MQYRVLYILHMHMYAFYHENCNDYCLQPNRISPHMDLDPRAVLHIIYCSPIPMLQTGIGFVPLRVGQKILYS